MRRNLLTSDWISLFAIVGAFGLLTGKPLLITLSTLVIIGWLIAKLWSNLALERLEFRRQLSQTRAFPGDDKEFRIHLTGVLTRRVLATAVARARGEAINFKIGH